MHASSERYCLRLPPLATVLGYASAGVGNGDPTARAVLPGSSMPLNKWGLVVVTVLLGPRDPVRLGCVVY